MMTSTVKKSSDLVKRIKRFLLRERRRDRALANLLDCLDSCRDVYLFGGVLRDIALYGISKLESDIDIVCAGPRDFVDLVVEENGFNFEKNKFGGLRVETECWFVDLWGAENTWAFREGGREYVDIKSLLDTTITNWESILCSLKECRLIYRENYFKDLNERYLHVVFDRNPNPLGMYVRIMRAYACKDASVLSSGAARVVSEALSAYSFEDMSAYERDHYQFQYIGEDVYEHFRKCVRKLDLLPIEMGKKKISLWGPHGSLW